MGAVLSLHSLSFLAVFFTAATFSPADSTPLVHFPPKPAILKVSKRNQVEDVSLQSLITSRCKSLFTQFNPPWWLFNGHLQTIYCVLGDFSKTDTIWYRRTFIRLKDGGTLGLDFAPVDDSHLKEDAPIIVIQHGLTGGSYESYIRCILVPACTPVEQGGLGFRACVVNFRGCAGVPVTSQQLYSAGATGDLRQALMYIAMKYPKAPLLGLGFSLGANVMTRYLAEDGEDSRLNSGCALACPWNLGHNNTGLLNSFLGKHIYSKGMGGNLLNLVKRHIVPLTADPEHRISKAMPFALALKNPTLRDFDHAFTRFAGGAPPIFPFASAEDYYDWASSDHVVKDIQVPFLAISAADDPVVRHVPMDGAGNKMVVMALTTGGGHLGWFVPGNNPSGLDRWVAKPVLEWLELVGKDLVHQPKGKPLYVDADGWIRQVGDDGLGCIEIEGGGVIDGNGGELGTLQGL